MVRKLASMALLSLGLLVGGLRAETVVVPGEREGFPTPPAFRLIATGVSYNDDFAYVWVEAEGNCRWEWKQECHVGANGQVICRPVSEWKCDRDMAYYRLPATVKVDAAKKRAYFVAEGANPLAFGKTKSFLWSKWIELFQGAKLSVTHQTADLVLDTEKLGTGAREANFLDLYEDRVD